MIKQLIITVVLIAVAIVSSADARLDKAIELTQKYPLVDGHIDVPYRLQLKWEDVTQSTPSGDFDYPRAKAGGLNAPFMSIYIPADKEAKGAKALADVLIDQVEAIVYRAPDKFAIPHSVADIRDHFKAGKISLPMGMENGAAIEGDLTNVKHFYNRGVRYITLAHSKSNHISDSSYDKGRLWQGLSPFGRNLVQEMNRVGIMVDISHVSDAAFYEVLNISKAPVITSHSSLRHFTPGMERNVNDKMLKALAKNNGVIMINFGSYFLTKTAYEYGEKSQNAKTTFAKLHNGAPTKSAKKVFDDGYKAKFPYPFATISDVVDHIDRVVKRVGIDHVGLGSDFDGVGDSLPIGLKDVAAYPHLVAQLLKRGYKEPAIAKILGGNILRVMEAVEQYAANSNKDK